jgi:uncharacterized protein (TIGR03067 family)
MKRNLPARPNLEHLRTQAKALLAKLREGNVEAARTLIQYLPEASTLSAAQVQERGFRLADAQAAVARKSGFAGWPGLARHVDRLRSMEGAWGFGSLEVDGSAMPAPMFANSRLLIDGDRFRMESPEGNYEGIFGIDVEQTPHHIDIDFVEGPEAGNRCKGIFRLEEDRLTICLGLVGAERPEGFATSRGSGHALEELVRVEHARPPGVDGGTAPVTAAEPVLVAADEPFAVSMTPTLERLQGEWQALELITSGRPLETAYLPYGLRSHWGFETKVVFGGQTMVHAKVRFNETASPIEVDYFHLAGKFKGSISPGLFRWDGEEAVYCMGAPGTARPSDFGCDAGSGRIFSRWKRKAQ